MNSVLLLSTAGFRLLSFEVLNKAKCLSFYAFNASTALQKAFACDGFFKVIVPFVTIPRWNGKSLIFTPVLLLSTGELPLFKRYKKL